MSTLVRQKERSVWDSVLYRTCWVCLSPGFWAVTRTSRMVTSLSFSFPAVFFTCVFLVSTHTTFSFTADLTHTNTQVRFSYPSGCNSNPNSENALKKAFDVMRPSKRAPQGHDHTHTHTQSGHGQLLTPGCPGRPGWCPGRGRAGQLTAPRWAGGQTRGRSTPGGSGPG